MNKRPTVAIIDYQMSNLFSVQHACEYVGLDSHITDDPEFIRRADAAILPGVGAFGDAMKNIRRLGIDRAIGDVVQAGKPFLGVCLGLQLLLTDSEEFGAHQGLNLIPGQVKKFPSHTSAGKVIKVPQIGWNKIHHPVVGPDRWPQSPLKETHDGEFMYFVHSYFAVPDSPDHALVSTTYEGLTYVSAVMRDNIVAFQFHPEKSGPEGIKIYRHWAASVAAL